MEAYARIQEAAAAGHTDQSGKPDTGPTESKPATEPEGDTSPPNTGTPPIKEEHREDKAETKEATVEPTNSTSQPNNEDKKANESQKDTKR